MARILVVGNSGSGKTTLARRLARERNLAHLELDTLAWKPGLPPERLALAESEKAISEFTRQNPDWVIEGCYADLLELVERAADEVIFLNPPIDDCVKNAESRTFEPGKFSSPAAQQENQANLIRWIRDYKQRTDVCSYQAHAQLFRRFDGKKTLVSEGFYPD